jgi:type I restriction-modification system DNA methylase subunit
MLPPIAGWTDDEVDAYLSSHLAPTTQNKEARGEVFTPPELVEKVLDTFPSRAWSRHDARWLEPSAGKGHFAVAIFRRLQKGLARWEPDPARRARHIVEKMLTMVELHRPHCTALRKLFGENATIVCADASRWVPDVPSTPSTPSTHSSTHPRFDYIVGNPPFQDEVRRTGARRITRAKNKLYERITLHCCQQLLNPRGGLLALIVPSNAFSGNRHALYAWMVDNAHVRQIAFLGNEPNYFPKVQHAMCYFSLQLHPARRSALATRIQSPRASSPRASSSRASSASFQ